MQFPREYFEAEVRDGFYINGLMKRAWAAQLEVLEEISNVCKKYNIRWYADCGTLLGAVRHGGYIPWDDDLDICMLRDDYERFKSIARAELPEGYIVLDYKTDEDYWELLLRVTNGNRINLDASHLEKYHGFPFVAGIDIFPLDYIAPDEAEEEIRRMLASIVQAAANREDIDNNPSEETLRLLRDVENVLNVKLDWSKALKLQLYDLMTSLFSLYTRDEAKEVALMPYWVSKYNHKYSLEWFERVIELPFEVTKIQVPAYYDAVLRVEYGDYERIWHTGGVHDYPFYEAQENQLIQLLGGKVNFKYTFKESDLQREGLQVKQNPKEVIIAQLKLLERTQKMLGESMHTSNIDLAEGILSQCQNVAIQIGTLIERYKGEDFITIRLLEEYCEGIYQFHQQMMNNGIDAALCSHQNLGRKLDEIYRSVEENIIMRREMVFLPWKASSWNSLESVWRAAKEDPDCDVYVIPIPYYDRKPDGTFGELHYDGELYPAEVSIYDFNKFDFASHRPDVIIINNPYDECNYTTSVHPFFYASNLKQYTDKLVYIPYFKTNEIGIENLQAIKSMKDFVTVPGVMHADYVIVQSEEMRNSYLHVLTEFCGIHTRELWERKLLGIGSPLDDKEQWFSNTGNDDKKVVMYYISTSLLLQYGEQMLDKMRSTFAIFKESRDRITLLWRTDEEAEKIVSCAQPQLWKAYMELVEEYRTEAWGIYDDGESDITLAHIDAYYGDPSSMVVKCRKMGIPVMYQDVSLRRRANYLWTNGGIDVERDTLWFVPQWLNLLCRVDLLTGNIEKTILLPDMALEYSGAYTVKKCGDYIAYVPAVESSVYIYNILADEMHRIPLKPKKYWGEKFYSVYQWRGNLYFMPRDYDSILRLSMEDMNTVDISPQEKGWHIKSTVQMGKRVYLVTSQSTLEIFDMEKESLKELEGDVEEKWSIVSARNEEELLLLTTEGILYIYNTVSEEWQQVDKMKDASYSAMAAYANKVFLFPKADGNRVDVLDLKSIQLHTIQIEKEGRESGVYNGEWGVFSQPAIANRKVYVMNAAHQCLYEIDAVSEDIRTIDLEMNELSELQSDYFFRAVQKVGGVRESNLPYANIDYLINRLMQKVDIQKRNVGMEIYETIRSDK